MRSWTWICLAAPETLAIGNNVYSYIQESEVHPAASLPEEVVLDFMAYVGASILIETDITCSLNLRAYIGDASLTHQTRCFGKRGLPSAADGQLRSTSGTRRCKRSLRRRTSTATKVAPPLRGWGTTGISHWCRFRPP